MLLRIILFQPRYCSICETLIMADDGAYCSSCGVCADQPDCISAANNSIICKKIETQDNSMKHHWIKGMFPFLISVF